VEAEVLTVNADDPAPLTEAGLKVAVAPVGRPLALSETVPLKPAMALTSMV